MKKEKQLLLYHLNKGQVIFLISSFVLVLFVFLVIILGNTSISSLQFSYIFRNYVSLRSLSISGLRYALYQINQNPGFTTSSAIVLMPQGSFNYSVSDITSGIKKIRVQANLTGGVLTNILNATATIDSSGIILDLEVSEE